MQSADGDNPWIGCIFHGFHLMRIAHKALHEAHFNTELIGASHVTISCKTVKLFAYFQPVKLAFPPDNLNTFVGDLFFSFRRHSWQPRLPQFLQATGHNVSNRTVKKLQPHVGEHCSRISQRCGLV